MRLDGQCISKTESWSRREHESHPVVKTVTCEMAFTDDEAAELKASQEAQIASLDALDVAARKADCQSEADAITAVLPAE